jgi:hypothetical protein
MNICHNKILRNPKEKHSGNQQIHSWNHRIKIMNFSSKNCTKFSAVINQVALTKECLRLIHRMRFICSISIKTKKKFLKPLLSAKIQMKVLKNRIKIKNKIILIKII